MSSDLIRVCTECVKEKIRKKRCQEDERDCKELEGY